MSNIYEIALQTGATVTKAVETYIRKAKKSDKTGFDPSPYRKKKMSDGSTIFMWSGKWNPYKYEFDMGLVTTIERCEELTDEAHAYMLVAVSNQDVPDIIFNDAGLEHFGDLYPGVIYPKEWFEDTSKKKYDIVLMEKPFDDDGLCKDEVIALFDHLKESNGIVLEIGNPQGNSTALGFIGPKAAEKLGWNYDSLKKAVGKILADMSLEREDHTYKHKGLKIWLSR